MPLQSVAETSRALQVIILAGVVGVLGRWRNGGADAALPSLIEAQAKAASEGASAVDPILAEQGIPTTALAKPVVSGLVGVASDGRPLLSLLQQARVEADMRRIVATQLADIARSSGSITAATRPRATRYVRALSGRACSRCAILAGKSFATGEAFDRHPLCLCRNIPTDGRNERRLLADPQEYFNGLSDDEQDRVFTKTGAEAIRRGTDMSQVVNARAGMSTAQVAIPGTGDRWTASGRLAPVELYGRKASVTTEGMTKRGLAYQRMAGSNAKVRLMPESIFQIAGSDLDEARRLLHLYGYIA